MLFQKNDILPPHGNLLNGVTIVIESNRQNYKMIAMLIATIAAGLPIWTRSLRQIDYTDPNFLILWLSIGIIASFTTLFFVNLKTWDMVSSFTIGYIIAVVLHFVGGILVVNYIHAQFAVALLISMGIGVASGLFGAYAWKGIKWKSQKK